MTNGRDNRTPGPAGQQAIHPAILEAEMATSELQAIDPVTLNREQIAARDAALRCLREAIISIRALPPYGRHPEA